MTRWIENVSWDDVVHGWHTDMGENAMLIRIGDPGTNFRPPKKEFKIILHYEFLDAEDIDSFPEETKISDTDAASIVGWLIYAKENHMNVLVHCHAGICRSGAVVEVATGLGFTPTGRFRLPNLRVKHKMMKALGWTYDSDEKQVWSGGDLD